MGSSQRGNAVPGRRLLVVLGAAVAFALTALAAPLGAAGVAGQAGEDGKAIYEGLCKGCHTIGGGKLVGPDMQGIADRRDADWVRAFILGPDKLIAAGDPIAKQLLGEYNNVPMPNLGVTEAQIGPLMTFLGFTAPAAVTTTTPAATTTTTPPATTTTAPAAAAGDVGRGKELFKGGDRFSAGGPACLSCHTIAGVGALGGGKIGPDLTGAFAKYGGAQGLSSALTTMAAFPTMMPIFSRNPLTAREQADLIAFLKTAPDQQSSGDATGKLVGFSLAGVALLGVFAMVVWRRRLNGVRKPLVNRSRGK